MLTIGLWKEEILSEWKLIFSQSIYLPKYTDLAFETFFSYLWESPIDWQAWEQMSGTYKQSARLVIKSPDPKPGPSVPLQRSSTLWNSVTWHPRNFLCIDHPEFFAKLILCGDPGQLYDTHFIVLIKSSVVIAISKGWIASLGASAIPNLVWSGLLRWLLWSFWFLSVWVLQAVGHTMTMESPTLGQLAS